jgi:hypothetical protein
MKSLWICCVFTLVYLALRSASSAISHRLYISAARCSYRSQLQFRLCSGSSTGTANRAHALHQRAPHAQVIQL